VSNFLEWMNKAAAIENELNRRLAVCSIVTKVFADRGLFEPVLVGGTAVALYTKGRYSTVDIDLKSEDVEGYKAIMTELGFVKVGKDYYNAALDIYIEFPSGRMEDSEHHMREIIVEATGLPVVVVGIEDVVLDRAMRFVATRDQDAREWALRMMGIHYDELDWSYLHRRASELHILDAVNRIQRDVKRYKGVYRTVKEKAEKSGLNGEGNSE